MLVFFIAQENLFGNSQVHALFKRDCHAMWTFAESFVCHVLYSAALVTIKDNYCSAIFAVDIIFVCIEYIFKSRSTIPYYSVQQRPSIQNKLSTFR